MFKKMLVPMCEECFRKFSCIACIDCYKGSSEFRPKLPLSPTQGDNMPIKEYLKLFEAYIVVLGLNEDHPGLKNIFISGLTYENKKELERLPFLSEPSLEHVVAYLSEVEAFKRSIMKYAEGNSVEEIIEDREFSS